MAVPVLKQVDPLPVATATPGDNTTKAASTAFVTAAIAASSGTTKPAVMARVSLGF